MKKPVEAAPDPEGYFARPFDPWQLAEEQGAEALVDPARRPIVSKPYQAVGAAQQAWKSVQRYRRLALGMPEEDEARSPIEQFHFAHHCELQRLKLPSGGRMPGAQVLCLVLECVDHGLLPPGWLHHESRSRFDRIRQGLNREWSEGDVFGSPHTEDLRAYRAANVSGPKWYAMCLEMIAADSKLVVRSEKSHKAKTVFSVLAEDVGCSAQTVEDHVKAYVEGAGGWLPPVAEFRKIMGDFRSKGITVEGALNHWYWGQWEKRG